MPLIFSHFEGHPDLIYGFSDRGEGSMHRHFEKSNRERYFRKIGIAPDHVVTANLAHGANVAKVSEGVAGTMISDTDGLVTGTKNLFLSATSADCFLLYFYDPAKKAVGIAHGGWRGVLVGIVGNTVSAFEKNFHIDPKDLLVGVAPGIRECHFEIRPDHKKDFGAYAKHISLKNGKVFVNLSGIIIEQLRDAGILREHIEDSGICTHCETEKYFSYRRDKPEVPHLMIGYIGLRDRDEH